MRSNFCLISATWQKCSAGTLALIVRAGRFTVMPFARMASTCAGHCSMKVTSYPAKTKSAPIEAPWAPVPTKAILGLPVPVPAMFCFLRLRAAVRAGPPHRAAAASLVGETVRGRHQLQLQAPGSEKIHPSQAGAGAIRERGGVAENLHAVALEVI